MAVRDRGDTWRRRLGVAVALLAVGCTAAAWLLWRWNDARTDLVVPLALSDVVLATVYPLAGALVVRQQPRNRLGWLLLATGLVGPYLLAGQYAVARVLVLDSPTALSSAATWLAAWGFTPYFLVFSLLLLVVPDGRPASPRLRPLVALVAALIVLGTVLRMVAQAPIDAAPALRNPVGFEGASWLREAFLISILASFVLGAPAGVVSLLVRLRRATGLERAQLQWVTLGGVVFVALLVIGLLLPRGFAEDLMLIAALCVIPVAVAVAAVRHGMFDVEVALNRALVYSLLTGAVLLGYAGTVAAVGALTPDRRLAYLAVAVAALIAALARDRVQGLVERLLYGERRDPYAIVARVGARLDLATGPADALARLVAELRHALRLPYAAVVADDERLAPVEEGHPTAEVETLVLRSQGQRVGVLRVGHRHRGEDFVPSETAALTDVARRAGSLVSAAALVHDLERSRERLVAAREEERRRLRRDLHDGVGPELAGMALQLDSLARRLADDPPLAERVGRLRDQARRTVAEVRRAVDDLRPPALDEVGLAAALRQSVASYAPLALPSGAGVSAGEAAPGGPSVTLLADDLPSLPASVEVAAYRIAGEAITNAVRHAAADRCVVRLGTEPGWLVVEVTDDGRGLPDALRPGVGLASMRDRAAEVGGRFDVVAGPDGHGTRVVARLPLEVA